MLPVNPHIFRAYDIRGMVETDLTPDVVQQIGLALGTLYSASKTVVVGRDGRLSSPMMARNLGQGLQASGRRVIDIGEVPTPVLYYATRFLDTGAGVMVTGSHNPPEYNGLKIIMGGKTLHGEAIQALCRRITTGPLHTGTGSLQREEVLNSYLAHILEDVHLDRTLRVGVDCGNGVAGPAVLRLLDGLGCEVIGLYCKVDGNFPHHHPNPSDPENLRELVCCVQDHALDLGLAFDGDGDRLGVVDDRGRVLWADRQMMLYARDVLSENPGAQVIFDVKSSKNLRDVIEQAGGKAVMWKTGHSLIKNKMAETGALLAGELSGHVFFGDRWYGFDDALYTASRLLEIIAGQPLSSSELFASLPDDLCTPEIYVHLEQDGAQHAFMQAFCRQVRLPGAQISTLDGVRAEYPQGWGLVRASNTTPSLVIRFEARTTGAMETIQAAFREQLLKTDSGLDLPF